MKTISKELFIMALLLMIVVFMIGMVFYKYMPNNKPIPGPVVYTADSTTTAVLQEISDSTTYSYSDDQKEVEDVIKSYSIGPKELSTAASKQTYISGKTDPFAEYVTNDPNSVNSTNSTNTTGGSTALTNSTTDTTSVPTNTAPKSSSTGTFFENKTSK